MVCTSTQRSTLWSSISFTRISREAGILGALKLASYGCENGKRTGSSLQTCMWESMMGNLGSVCWARTTTGDTAKLIRMAGIEALKVIGSFQRTKLLSPIACNGGTQVLFSHRLFYRTDRRIAKTRDEELGKTAAQRGQRAFGTVRKLSRLGPWHGLGGLHDEQGTGCAIGKLFERYPARAFERRAGADEDAKCRHAGWTFGRTVIVVNPGHLRQQGEIGRAVPRLIELELFVDRLLFDVGQDRHPPAQQRLAVLRIDRRRRQGAMDVGVIVHGERDLLEIVGDLATGA